METCGVFFFFWISDLSHATKKSEEKCVMCVYLSQTSSCGVCNLEKCNNLDTFRELKQTLKALWDFRERIWLFSRVSGRTATLLWTVCLHRGNPETWRATSPDLWWKLYGSFMSVGSMQDNPSKAGREWKEKVIAAGMFFCLDRVVKPTHKINVSPNHAALIPILSIVKA